ncbi:hypothetical protein QUF64_12540 [Anaerolineales bacterium HSG6]|nr:hypothetical protein [Anaerolineales bacterium HSG6]
MATYPIEQIMTEYGNARMDVEMTTGHALQHIQLLYQALKTANQQQRELRNQLNVLETRVSTLQTDEQRYRKLRDKLTGLDKQLQAIRAKLNRLWERQTEYDKTDRLDKTQLTALSLTVHQVKAVLDSLTDQLGVDDVTASAKN